MQINDFTTSSICNCFVDSSSTYIALNLPQVSTLTNCSSIDLIGNSEFTTVTLDRNIQQHYKNLITVKPGV